MIKTIQSAVQKLVDKVSPTYGPAGRKIFVFDENFGQTYDDGLKVARGFKLDDPLENAIVRFVVSGMEETNIKVGDGSTTFPILVNAMLKCEPNEIKDALSEAIGQIKDKSKDIKTLKDLEKVAYNSYKNEELSKLIAQIVWETGKDGVVTIEESKENSIEKTTGMIFDWTFDTPYFINNNKGQSEIEDPYILVTERTINNLKEFLPIIQEYKSIVVVGNVEGEPLNVIILNKMQGRMSANIIKPYGESKETLLDICAVTGATLITQGMPILPQHLGRAKKVISTHEKTTIIKGAGDPTQRISEITDKKRLASIKGDIGVIKITANTEKELKAIKEKVDDSLNATQQALKYGIVKGGAMTYKEIKTKSEAFNKALQEPRNTLEKNGTEHLDDNSIDATNVLTTVLENAVSIAQELLNTKDSVDARIKKNDNS